MKVSLRKRNQGGKTSLYLDYYNKGKRKTEYLKLYLTENPKTKEEKELNKSTYQLAETIKAQRQVEIQKGMYGFLNQDKQKARYIKYIELLIAKKIEKNQDTHNLVSLRKHIRNFCTKDISFFEIDKQFIADFKYYLDTKAIKTNGVPLANNTKFMVFSVFKQTLNIAVKENLLQSTQIENVKSFKPSDSVREFLTLTELQTLVKQPCKHETLKTAFIFSCLTGLRWSDIHKLTWAEIQFSNEMGNYIRFTQKKTKGAETLPISDQALELLGTRTSNQDRVFKDLKYNHRINVKLRNWLATAGIEKNITFHCARHTFATLQLTLETDIYTVSKLLGHRDLKSTQVYAKIIDLKKKEAVNKIKI